MKKILICFIILTLSLYIFWSYQPYYSADYFRLVFFDVGQGDSALIVTPNGRTILIDGGPDNKVLRGLGKFLPFWRRQIDLLVVSHAHDDHLMGLSETIRRYKIKNILYNNLDFDTPAVNYFLKSVKDKKIKTISAQAGMAFNFDENCVFTVLAAEKNIQKNDNDYSIVSGLNCLSKKVLFSGDAGVAIESKLITSGVDLKADILKLSHHGSLSASSLNFLEAVNPKIALISVGKDNKFGHPSTLILNRLESLAVDIYRTDISGQLSFLANYKTIKLIK